MGRRHQNRLCNPGDARADAGFEHRLAVVERRSVRAEGFRARDRESARHALRARLRPRRARRRNRLSRAARFFPRLPRLRSQPACGELDRAAACTRLRRNLGVSIGALRDARALRLHAAPRHERARKRGSRTHRASVNRIVKACWKEVLLRCSAVAVFNLFHVTILAVHALRHHCLAALWGNMAIPSVRRVRRFGDQANVQTLFDAALRQQLQGSPCARAVERTLSSGRGGYFARREPHTRVSCEKS